MINKTKKKMKIKIDKNVPVPVSTGKGRQGKYPWSQMKVGDSILLDCKTIGGASSCIYTYISRHKLSWKYAVRKERNKFRVWRIK